jgi:hypothetical protein
MIPFLQKLHAAAKGHMFAPENFTGADFTYRIGRTIFRVGDSYKNIRRGARRWLRSPVLASKRAALLRHIRQRDWKRVRANAVSLAHLAEKASEPRLMEEIGKMLIALSDYERAARLRLASRQLRRDKNPKEWEGEKVDGLLLVNFVEHDHQGMGSVLKSGFFLPEAAKRAPSCTAIVQPRLRAIFIRTFPHIEIIASDDPAKKTFFEKARKIAGAEHLDYYIGDSADKIRSLFAPLKADDAAADAFRTKYRKAGKPLIGISWGSSAYAKEVPLLEEWARFIKNIDAQFVSLQYGKIESEVAQLEAQSGKTIIHDESVDQLTDMDQFAAQIAALDAVVTISNTGAHLTGALGVPVIVLNDDNFRRAWPVDTDEVPHYPAASVIQKAGRPWDVVMDEVTLKLQKLILRRTREV